MKPLLLPLVLAASLLAGAASAQSFPARLADQVGNDPLADTPDCIAAQTDARAWNEKSAVGSLRNVGRFIVWPLAERAAQRRNDIKDEAREVVMEALRQSCFTQPSFTRAEPVPGQRWPAATGYDRPGGFNIIVGGRDMAALVHPTFNTIWIRARSGGPGYIHWKDEDFVRSVAWAIEPTGCRVTQDRAAENHSREVGYVCPEGVNLRQLVESKSDLVRRGSWPNPR